MNCPTGRFELWVRDVSGRILNRGRFDSEEEAREHFALTATDQIASAWIFDTLTRHKQHIA